MWVGSREGHEFHSCPAPYFRELSVRNRRTWFVGNRSACLASNETDEPAGMLWVIYPRKWSQPSRVVELR